jgi:hypothetical protein
MPAKSQSQRRLMAIALHHPGMIKAKNKGVLSMSKSDLRDFASTPEKGLASHLSDMKEKGKIKSKRKGKPTK